MPSYADIKLDTPDKIVRFIDNHEINEPLAVLKPWPQRIAEARHDGGFGEDDENLAGNWVTCACGQADAGIAREVTTGAPLDRTLEALGRAFSDAVMAGRTDRGSYEETEYQIDQAEEILGRIQQRALELLSAKKE